MAEHEVVADLDAGSAPSGLSVDRLNRRAAMRAAAGGAVAAGVFVAPRVVGMSIVPNYASAASGDNTSIDDTINSTTKQANSAPLCGVKCCTTCWNSTGISVKCAGSSCTCGTHKSCGNSTNDAVSGTLTINKNSPVGSSINLDYSLWGPTEMTCASGTPQTTALTLTLAGIDPPFQSCDVSVTGSCGAGTFGPTNPSPGTVTGITSNGIVAIPAPTCTGSNLPAAPAAAACPAAATVTITLSCTFA